MRSENDGASSAFRRPGFLAAAVLLGAVVLAGAVVAIIGHGHGAAATTPAAAQPAPPRSAGRLTTAQSSGDCGPLPVGSQAVPRATPVTQWRTVGVMAAPVASATLGPERRVDGVGECFAHNPLGALYAAANLLAAFTAMPQVQVISDLAADTPERTAAIAGAKVGYNPDLQQALGGTPSISGFSFVSYSPEQADVNVDLSLSSGEQPVIELSLLWQNGDWRFVVPPRGNLIGTESESSVGSVAWGAQ